MKYIPTDWSIPYYNMALENFLMNSAEYDEDYVFFYIHKPSVIVGKHQNTMQEINYPYIKGNNITVARRISGGGAVYHDEGNLNFSFIVNRNGRDSIDFEPYTRPVIDALKKLGVCAELSGRNDILIEGRKFSGNAQYMNKKKILSHGTLMFDVNIENMVNALNVDNLKIESKAIASVRSRVANLKSYLNKELSIHDFKDHLLNCFFEEMPIEELKFPTSARGAIEHSVKHKFSTWEHNFGASPAFSIQKKKKFTAGIVQIGLEVKDGKIEEAKFTGDFFANIPVEVLEQSLININLNENDIMALNGIENVIAGFTKNDLVSLIFY